MRLTTPGLNTAQTSTDWPTDYPGASQAFPPEQPALAAREKTAKSELFPHCRAIAVGTSEQHLNPVKLLQSHHLLVALADLPGPHKLSV